MPMPPPLIARAAAPSSTPVKKGRERARGPVPLAVDAAVGTDDDANNVHTRPHRRGLLLFGDMERTAQALCDETRQQYELMIQRQETYYAGQLQGLQDKLKALAGTCVPLRQHEQALQGLTEGHRRDLEELARIHREDLARQQRRWRQAAEAHAQRSDKRVQGEMAGLLDRIAELELDRDDALQQWRLEELAALTARQECEEAIAARQLAEGKVREACRHLAGLKSQLSKIDALRAKLHDERAARAAAEAQWQQRHLQLVEAKADAERRVSVLETDAEASRREADKRRRELADVRIALEARTTSLAEFQATVAELRVKLALLEDFHAAERERNEATMSELRATNEALVTAATESRERLTRAEIARHAAEAEAQTLRDRAAAAAAEHERSLEAAAARARDLEERHTRAKRALRRLATAESERRDEQRLSDLLFHPRHGPELGQRKANQLD